MKKIQKRLLRAVQVTLGSIVGYFMLMSLTYLAIWRFVPRVHDVQFVLLITVISCFGSILGAVSTTAILLSKVRRFKLAGSLTLVFGILGLALGVSQVVMAQQVFDDNKQPFIDALAYFGFMSIWSMFLVIYGVLLISNGQAKRPNTGTTRR